MLARPPTTLVVNFNGPELNQLAGHLAAQQRLGCFVRPYVNKGRPWERWLERAPLLRSLYATSFGRRRLNDETLSQRTQEAGVALDFAQAAVGRMPLLPGAVKHRVVAELHRRLRDAVAAEGGRQSTGHAVVVAHEGFAWPAFRATGASETGERPIRILNYPVTHHRHRRRVREAELEREPAFAVTWPGFDDWGRDHEAQLDEEIDRADGILLGSGYAADTFAAEGVDRGKLFAVPYGVDLRTFTPPVEPVPDAPFRVIYSGQLTQRKGLSYLLRGYQRFRRRDSELVLVGAPVGSLQPLQPFAELFRHVPHQTRSALAQRYRESSVFVFPTLVEGMGLVVLEAMACGLPVIVTANGPSAVVRDGVDGFIVPERDEAAICDRLERVYLNPELRRAMGRNAAARAREFSWAAYASRAAQSIDEATARVRAGASAAAAPDATLLHCASGV